jgi:sulfur carrier protein
MQPLQIDVNGESHALEQGCTVAGLLERLGLAGKRVAVAVNRNVVVRARYEDVRLEADDRVEILEAVGGG